MLRAQQRDPGRLGLPRGTTSATHNASCSAAIHSAILVGVGVLNEPALNLMPLLTLRPRAVLIDDPQFGRANSFTVKLTGLDTVAHAAQQIVHFVNEHASATTRNFPDAAAIDAQLQREIDSAQSRSDEENEDEVDDSSASDFDTRLRFVVLAAMGRHEDARALLATYPAERTDEAIDRDDRRFIRQLTRWLDAGGPVAPPSQTPSLSYPGGHARHDRPGQTPG